jgi:hypothetical protein
MEDGNPYTERFNKQIRALLFTFEKAREWEWSDLIKWLRKLHAVLEKFPHGKIPDCALLAKRLSQCLDPALPHGLHSIVLQVYDTIFNMRKANNEGLDHTFALLSAGIIPFFPKASQDIKAEIVQLIQKHYSILGEDLDFILPGLIPSLLYELDDGGQNELSKQIIALFNNLSQKKSQGVICAVWQNLLKNPSVRLGALKYLNQVNETPGGDYFMPQSSIVMNALLAGLEDSNVLVKRATLDFMISYFPIHTDFFSDHEKMTLMESILLIMVKKDATILRRVWEYALGTDPSVSPHRRIMLHALLTDSLKKIFRTSNTHDNLLVSLEILEEILGKEINNDDLLEGISVDIIIYTRKLQYYKVFEDQILGRCQKIFIQYSLSVWKSLHDFVLNNLKYDTNEVIITLEFYLKNFPADKSEVIQLVPILEVIIDMLDHLQPETLMQTFNLAQILSNRLSSVTGLYLNTQISSLHRFFIKLCKTGTSSEILKNAATLCFELQRFVSDEVDIEWLSPLISIANDGDLELSLAAIECITIILNSKNKVSYRIQEKVRTQRDLCTILIKKLWRLIDNPESKSIIEGCIMLHSVFPSLFLVTLADSLVSGSLVDKAENIRRFTMFWKITHENYPSSLSKIFTTGEGIFNMLDYLDDEKPLIRHCSREWLLQALPQFACIIDPLLEILLLPITKLEGQSIMYYTQMFDSRRILNCLKKLKSIILSAGDETIRAALKADKNEKFMAQFPTRNYLELLLQVTLKFITTEPATQLSAEFKEECRSVQAAACELMKLILERSNPVYAYSTVVPLLEFVEKSLKTGDTVMQLLIFEILNVVFFQFETDNTTDQFIELIHADSLHNVLLESLGTSDIYVRNHWVKLLSKLTPLLITHLDPQKLQNFICRLIRTYCSIIAKSHDRTSLFMGLGSTLRETLESLQSKIETVRDPSPSKNILVGVFKMLSHSSKSSHSPNQFLNTFNAIIRKLKKVLGICTVVCEYKAGMNVSIKGTEPIWNVSDVNKIEAEEIIHFLRPIGLSVPKELIETSINIWNSILDPDKDFNDRDITLQKLVRIFISLDLSPLIYITSTRETLKRHHKSKSSKVAHPYPLINFIHFLYSILSHIPQDHYTSLTTDQIRQIWYESMRLVKYLDRHSTSEVSIWTLEFIHLIAQKLPIKQAQLFKKWKKELQDVVQKLYNQVTMSCFETKVKLLHPLPPSVYAVGDKEEDVSIGSLLTLKNTLFQLSLQVWNDEIEEKVISQIQSAATPVVRALIDTSSVLHVETVTELLCSLLDSCTSILAKFLKKDMIDFLFSEEFFSKMSSDLKCFKNWCRIYNSIVAYCYHDRTSILTEILSKITTHMFVTKNNETLQKAKILKCFSFLIYSGSKDDYCSCITLICEKIIDYLRNSEGHLVPCVFLLLRVMLIRFSAEFLSDFWTKVWPHIMTELMNIFSDRKSINQMLSGLKLLEELSLLNQRDFLLYQWIFFYDVFNVELTEGQQHSGYWPLIPQIFTSQFSARVNYRVDGITTQIEKTPRGLVLTQTSVEDLDELELRARTLLQYMIYHNVERSIVDLAAIEQVIENEFVLDHYIMN